MPKRADVDKIYAGAPILNERDRDVTTAFVLCGGTALNGTVLKVLEALPDVSKASIAMPVALLAGIVVNAARQPNPGEIALANNGSADY